MNISKVRITTKSSVQLGVLGFTFFLLSNYIFAQQTDTIFTIQKDPEEILKKVTVKSIARNGFNFWQDNFSGHWSGIDIGFNVLLDPDYSGYEPKFMDNDIFRSNSLYINLIQQSIGLQRNRNNIGVVTGLGMHFQSYRLNQNTTIERISNDVIAPKTLFFDDNQKSKLSIFSLTLPVLAEFQIPVKNYENRLYFSSGTYISYRISSHTKIKYRKERKEKLKVPDHYSLNDIKYGIMFRTGYRWINVFAAYELTSLFKDDKGPELTPFTFGVTLLSF